MSPKGCFLWSIVIFEIGSIGSATTEACSERCNGGLDSLRHRHWSTPRWPFGDESVMAMVLRDQPYHWCSDLCCSGHRSHFSEDLEYLNGNKKAFCPIHEAGLAWFHGSASQHRLSAVDTLCLAICTYLFPLCSLSLTHQLFHRPPIGSKNETMLPLWIFQ